ncbi:ABC-F family ATP-binding cassette domain-containing protein [Enterococcus dispar]|uniref:ABC transporter ATP-binding protein n=2 Tax=Enterococcus dispar TaxID=44009 RepID=S0KD43_9ENTE|nr:ABC-F family ATP-binding cassette domain-containing protein [Enterococcus dispar]EOT42824.1 ABC transporter ATP-binding protein [Enterococcus dispar ATCC 51266]EOW84725.1 ABC transporter ATP-binding protein [Enterococcus dispar ATCC 51266]MCU7356328.1 ABC-F family ATP-binding cassette domain-containing protein [Enterococcus dispar]MDT2704633.1 ABC-F family ATP-binding cassette domain-containing protein [Enterococcus dispar]OJG38134.1 ABC transporter ATP-binding protein [Enterococcus dispar]
MKELKVTGLHKTYGEKTLFYDLNFMIHEKDRIGLIGINGTGKSSLLKIIAGIESGDGDLNPLDYAKDYRIAYLAQESDFDNNQTVLQAVFESDSIKVQVVREYEQALQQLAEDGNNNQAQKRFAKAEAAMNEQDAWQTDTNAKIILQKLGIHQLHEPIKNLSGGQQKRVGLAQVLIDEPDLLLLDEPTNHLDYDAITWLENYLKNYRGALLMVTHDRYFLDRVTNRIFELSNGELQEFSGNYEHYLAAKAERERVNAEVEQKKKQLYKQELAWMRAGAKARTTKQQARINRFEDLKESMGQTKNEEQVAIEMATKRLGKKVIEFKQANYAYDNKVILTNFDLLVQARERIGITGENGAGKSTLLNIISGKIPLQSGILTIGETVRMAYYTQQNDVMDPNQRMINYLQEVAEMVKKNDGTQVSVTEMLERFLFPRQTHGTPIGKLSGGEKRRLFLLKLLMGQPNVLLLDEPTNDLDIATLTVLEDYLDTFPGAVLTVSHDRYFLDKVAEKLLVFKGNGVINSYFGSITDYLAENTADISVATTTKKVAESLTKEATTKKKLTYMEQKEWQTIEEDITLLEEKIATLTEEMNHQGADFTKLQELQKQISESEKILEDKMQRWEYLSEFATE